MNRCWLCGVERREHGEDRLSHMLWGLLPGWVKDPLQAPRPINARAETIAEKASFRGPWRHHRCLLPSTGFFEKGHLIQRKDRQLFWLAGVWDRWIGPDGSEVETCCVITTQPNSLVAPLHDRMPVIIPEGLESIWLEPGDGAHRRALEPMLTPAPAEPWDCRALKPAAPANKHRSSPCSIEQGLTAAAHCRTWGQRQWPRCWWDWFSGSCGVMTPS